MAEIDDRVLAAAKFVCENLKFIGPGSNPPFIDLRAYAEEIVVPALEAAGIDVEDREEVPNFTLDPPPNRP